jgi:hypothetical protein
MEFSKGKWKEGKHWGTVVTDDGEGFPRKVGHDETEYYGGYLIAESVAKKADVKLISSAPDLLKVAQELLKIYEKYANDSPDEDQIADAARAIIKKATE